MGGAMMAGRTDALGCADGAGCSEAAGAELATVMFSALTVGLGAVLLRADRSCVEGAISARVAWVSGGVPREWKANKITPATSNPKHSNPKRATTTRFDGAGCRE